MFSFGKGTDRHVIGTTQETGRVARLMYNETWFQVLDIALETAAFLGVRLIIPFINMVENNAWGGAAELCDWAGVAPSQFYTSNATKLLYKVRTFD